MAVKRPLGVREALARRDGLQQPPSDRPGASLMADGDRLRDRQPEGRRRQDDDGRQPRRVRRRGGLRGAAGRHRPAVQRDARARPRQGRAPDRLRRADRRRRARGRDRADRRSSICLSLRRAPIWPAPRRAAADRRLRDAAARRAGPSPRDRYAFTLLDCPPSLGPADRQRPRRRRPGDRARYRPSTSRSRVWPACSTRSR